MKNQIFLLAVVLFLGKVSAQQCYQCGSITTDGAGLEFLSDFLSDDASCDGSLQIVDCSSAGGCLKADYTYQYDVEGYGTVSASIVLRTCGSALDYCLSDSELQQGIAQEQAALDALLPSSGVTVASASGNICICSGNLCNSSPVLKVSFIVLLLSLLLSYVAIKW